MKRVNNRRLLIAVAAVVAASTLITGCAGWERTKKNMESNWGNGLNRTVEIYDVNGEKIKEYQGKFDIVFNKDTGRILFDDDGDKRHIIFPGTSTVVIDEK